MITNRGELLAYLGKTGSATDAEVALIDFIQRHTERAVKKFVGYEVELASYVEIHPPPRPGQYPDDLAAGEKVLSAYGSQVDFLHLRNLPVRSVVSVHETYTEGGGGWPDAALLDPSDYYVDGPEEGVWMSGLLARAGGSWSPVPRSVRVAYTAGWSADELRDRACHFQEAVQMEVARRFRQAETLFDPQGGSAVVGPLTYEDFNGWRTDAEPQAIKTLLGQWVNLSPAVQMLLQQDRRMTR